MGKLDTNCVMLEKCPFFNNLSLEKSSEVLKILYCRGRYNDCERYKKRRAGEDVPSNMWPNGKIVEGIGPQH